MGSKYQVNFGVDSGKPMENQWKINENPLLIRKCLNKIFDDQKKVFFKTKFFGTYILAEVLKNEFLWQSDKVRGHQSTVYRSRKFAKNQENTYVLGHTPMGAIMCAL